MNCYSAVPFLTRSLPCLMRNHWTPRRLERRAYLSWTLAFPPADDTKIFLEGHRFTAQEAIENKLVDEVSDGDSNAVFQAAMTRAVKLSHFPRLGVYGLIKVRV